MPNGTVPYFVTLYDSQNGSYQTLYLDSYPQWNGSYNAYDYVNGEQFEYYEGDLYFGGDEALYDINEGAWHSASYDSWTGTTSFTDFNWDYSSGGVPSSITLYDAQNGTNQNLFVLNSYPQWDGSYYAYDSLTYEGFNYYPGDLYITGDEALYDINEGAWHSAYYDSWTGTTSFTDYNPDYSGGVVPSSITLYDAQNGTNQTLFVDSYPQWDGSYYAYDSLTFEGFNYYPGDPYTMGDEALYDVNEGAWHSAYYDSWTGTTSFTDYNPDYFFWA